MRHHRPYRYFAHLAVWMALILLYIYPSLKGALAGGVLFKWTFVKYVVYGFINFQLFYLLVFVLLPAVVKKRQYGRMVVYTIASVFGFSIIKYLIGYFIFPNEVLFRAIPLRVMASGMRRMVAAPVPMPMTFMEYLPLTIQVGTGVALLACGYRLFLEWRNAAPEDRLLATTAAHARRRYERMQEGSRQLLYNLQQLAPLLEDPGKREMEGTRAMLLLSDLLRYMLYDKALENDKVSLKKELLNLERYIELRGLCNPAVSITLQMTGAEPAGLVEALRLQYVADKRIRELQGSPGGLMITLHVSNDILLVAVTSECSAHHVLPDKINIYPADE
jgi:two-component system, LytTR family, sensor kinase